MNDTDIAQAIEQLGLTGAEVCVHASMRSLGCPVEGGIATCVRTVYFYS